MRLRVSEISTGGRPEARPSLARSLVRLAAPLLALVATTASAPSPAAAATTAAATATATATAATTARPVWMPSVAVEIPVAGARGGDYVISFGTSISGALAAGSGTISIVAPAGTVFSGCFRIQDRTAGTSGQGCTGAPGPAISIVTPIDIGADHPVDIVLWDSTNMTAVGAHPLTIQTSSDTVVATVAFALIAPAPVTDLTVGLSDLHTGATAVTYTVAFTTSGFGHLPAYLGTITLAGPPGTAFGSGTYLLEDLTSGARAQFWAGSGTTEVTFHPFTDIGVGSQLRITVPNVTNGGAFGTQGLTVRTSADLRNARTTFSLVPSNAPSTVDLTTATNPSVYGQSVTVRAAVRSVAAGAPTPAGSVQFTIDGIDQPALTLTRGAASFALPRLAVGTHTVVATYSGNDMYAASTSAPLDVIVNQAATTTTLTSSANPSPLLRPATVRAIVRVVAPGRGPATGLVTFTIDGVAQPPVAMVSGAATLRLPTLAAGTHTIGASYGGDESFVASAAGDLTQIVTG